MVAMEAITMEMCRIEERVVCSSSLSPSAAPPHITTLRPFCALGRQRRGAGDGVESEEEAVGAGCSRKGKQDTDEVGGNMVLGLTVSEKTRSRR